MASFRLCWVACLLLASCAASAQPCAHPSADSWAVGNRAERSNLMTITVALKLTPRGQDALDKAFIDVALQRSRPPMSLAELTGALAVGGTGGYGGSKEVSSWLLAGGALSAVTSLDGASVTASLPVSAVEALFSRPVHHFRHTRSSRTVLRVAAACGGSDNANTLLTSTLPPQIRPFVDVITGLADFFERRDEMSNAAATAPGPGGATDSSPWISRILGDTKTIIIELVLRCKGGAGTDNSQNPCSDVAGSTIVTSISAALTSGASMKWGVNESIQTAQCSPSAGDLFVPPNNTICTLSIPVAESPSSVSMSIWSTFDDGTTASTRYPFKWTPSEVITPKWVADNYLIPAENRVGKNAKNSQAVVSFMEQYWSNDDRVSFNTLTGVTQDNVPRQLGFNDDAHPTPEATLDVQWIMGVGQGVKTTSWTFPPSAYILDWALEVGNTTSPPLITSLSYGDTEAGYKAKAGYGQAYMVRLNEEMKKMAVRGLTVMCSAGDAGWTDVGFGGNDLSGASVTSCDKGQAPIFPASSPYVTSVGSHFLTSSGTMVASSVRAGKSWTTGGGFAGLSPTPAYQSAEVSDYLKSTPEKPQPGLFNEGGRAYPDLSLIGDNIECVMNGRIFPLQGTSSSGPIAAGLFALINDARLNAGMSPLGFLNPSLYRWHQNNTQAFSDVTQGFNNDGLVQPPYTGFPAQCDQGFAATKGWDAVSGLGAPVFPPLLKLALEQR